MHVRIGAQEHVGCEAGKELVDNQQAQTVDYYVLLNLSSPSPIIC